jgi:hypothetical protein
VTSHTPREQPPPPRAGTDVKAEPAPVAGPQPTPTVMPQPGVVPGNQPALGAGDRPLSGPIQPIGGIDLPEIPFNPLPAPGPRMLPSTGVPAAAAAEVKLPPLKAPLPDSEITQESRNPLIDHVNAIQTALIGLEYMDLKRPDPAEQLEFKGWSAFMFGPAIAPVPEVKFRDPPGALPLSGNPYLYFPVEDYPASHAELKERVFASPDLKARTMYVMNSMPLLQLFHTLDNQGSVHRPWSDYFKEIVRDVQKFYEIIDGEYKRSTSGTFQTQLETLHSQGASEMELVYRYDVHITEVNQLIRDTLQKAEQMKTILVSIGDQTKGSDIHPMQKGALLKSVSNFITQLENNVVTLIIQERGIFQATRSSLEGKFGRSFKDVRQGMGDAKSVMDHYRKQNEEILKKLEEEKNAEDKKSHIPTIEMKRPSAIITGPLPTDPNAALRMAMALRRDAVVDTPDSEEDNTPAKPIPKPMPMNSTMGALAKRVGDALARGESLVSPSSSAHTMLNALDKMNRAEVLTEIASARPGGVPLPPLLTPRTGVPPPPPLTPQSSFVTPRSGVPLPPPLTPQSSFVTPRSGVPLPPPLTPQSNLVTPRSGTRTPRHPIPRAPPIRRPRNVEHPPPPRDSKSKRREASPLTDEDLLEDADQKTTSLQPLLSDMEYKGSESMVILNPEKKEIKRSVIDTVSGGLRSVANLFVRSMTRSRAADALVTPDNQAVGIMELPTLELKGLETETDDIENFGESLRSDEPNYEEKYQPGQPVPEGKETKATETPIDNDIMKTMVAWGQHVYETINELGISRNVRVITQDMQSSDRPWELLVQLRSRAMTVSQLNRALLDSEGPDSKVYALIDDFQDYIFQAEGKHTTDIAIAVNEMFEMGHRDAGLLNNVLANVRSPLLETIDSVTRDMKDRRRGFDWNYLAAREARYAEIERILTTSLEENNPYLAQRIRVMLRGASLNWYVEWGGDITKTTLPQELAAEMAALALLEPLKTPSRSSPQPTPKRSPLPPSGPPGDPFAPDPTEEEVPEGRRRLTRLFNIWLSALIALGLAVEIYKHFSKRKRRKPIPPPPPPPPPPTPPFVPPPPSPPDVTPPPIPPDVTPLPPPKPPRPAVIPFQPLKHPQITEHWLKDKSARSGGDPGLYQMDRWSTNDIQQDYNPFALPSVLNTVLAEFEEEEREQKSQQWKHYIKWLADAVKAANRRLQRAGVAQNRARLRQALKANSGHINVAMDHAMRGMVYYEQVNKVSFSFVQRQNILDRAFKTMLLNGADFSGSAIGHAVRTASATPDSSSLVHWQTMVTGQKVFMGDVVAAGSNYFGHVANFLLHRQQTPATTEIDKLIVQYLESKRLNLQGTAHLLNEIRRYPIVQKLPVFLHLLQR